MINSTGRELFNSSGNQAIRPQLAPYQLQNRFESFKYDFFMNLQEKKARFKNSVYSEIALLCSFPGSCGKGLNFLNNLAAKHIDNFRGPFFISQFLLVLELDILFLHKFVRHFLKFLVMSPKNLCHMTHVRNRNITPKFHVNYFEARITGNPINNCEINLSIY